MEELKKVQEELGAERLKNAALEAAVEELTAENAELKAKSGSKGSVTSQTKVIETPATPFTVDKVDYRFTVPSFSHEGETITATEALKDKTLLAELVKGGYGVIEKIEK